MRSTFFLLFLFILTSCATKCPHHERFGLHKNDVRKKNVLIAADAGHGGNDGGTQSNTKKYLEKNLTLVTALMLKDHLEDLGYKVTLTRNNDNYIPLKKRVQIAKKRKADLFISIHYNSAPNKKAKGVEIFYSTSDGNKKRAHESKKLAHRALFEITKQANMGSRGVKRGDFYVIRKPDVPAILVEGGFLSNDREMKRLKSPKQLNKIAWGLAKGIDKYLSAS